MSTPDFRALCEELIDLLDGFGSTFNIPIETSVVRRARAALAEPVNDLLEMGILVTNCHISGPVPEPFTNWNDYFIDVQKSGTLSGLKIEAICNRHPAAPPAPETVLPYYQENNNLEKRLATCIEHELRHGGNYLAAAASITREIGLGYIKLPTVAPAPVVVPVAVSDALIKAECALSDISEGEETNAAPNTFEWAEQRCAEALAVIRPVMKLHKIRTSEWPLLPLRQGWDVEA